MDILIVGVLAAVYMGILVLWSTANAKKAAALPAPSSEPPPTSMTVLRQLQASPWTKLAKRQGWPLKTRQLDPRRSKLDIQWGEGQDALYVAVLLVHSEEEAVASTHFSVPCQRPAKGLLGNRKLMAQAMSWQGVMSGRRMASRWLSELEGPQELSWEPEDLLGSQHGMLTLTLPGQAAQVSDIRAGLRALRAALLQARHPGWASLAHERGWSLSHDASKTLPILAGTLEGAHFRATLRKKGRGLQTQVFSISVPELLPELRIEHIAHGQGQAAELNHPIAGSMIHAVSPHLAALRLLVNNPQVFGPLMAVVHGYPGSSLSNERIELLAEGDLKLELLAAIQAVADLSAALARHFAPTSGPAD